MPTRPVILLTGASGQLGVELARALSAATKAAARELRGAEAQADKSSRALLNRQAVLEGRLAS